MGTTYSGTIMADVPLAATYELLTDLVSAGEWLNNECAGTNFKLESSQLSDSVVQFQWTGGESNAVPLLVAIKEKTPLSSIVLGVKTGGSHRKRLLKVKFQLSNEAHSPCTKIDFTLTALGIVKLLFITTASGQIIEMLRDQLKKYLRDTYNRRRDEELEEERASLEKERALRKLQAEQEEKDKEDCDGKQQHEHHHHHHHPHRSSSGKSRKTSRVSSNKAKGKSFSDEHESLEVNPAHEQKQKQEQEQQQQQNLPMKTIATVTLAVQKGSSTNPSSGCWRYTQVSQSGNGDVRRRFQSF